MGGGFNNSDWIGAIDNTGENVILHHRGHVQLIQKNYPPEILAQLVEDGTINLRKHKDLISYVHVFSGPQKTQHQVLQIGDLCTDEILELSLDEPIPADSMKHSQLSKTSTLDQEERIGRVLRADNPNDVIQIGLEHGDGKDEPELASVVSSSKSKLDIPSQPASLTANITP